jgi:hypothetical protein
LKVLSVWDCGIESRTTVEILEEHI